MIAVVLLLLVHHVVGELPKQSNYVLKKFDSCPSDGYFFKREENTVNLTCYLCFCRDTGEATCWPRENQRCDAESYHLLETKKENRTRRSPEPNPIITGLSDIFFRDAARDLFDKQAPEDCKPFQASYSEGCPPADWCIGCTVCDCDSNGHWDCHVLSFCDKGGGSGQPPKDIKYPKKHRTRRRSYAPKAIENKAHTKPTRTPQPKNLTKKSKKKPKKGRAIKKKPTSTKKPSQFTKKPTPTRVPKKASQPKKQHQHRRHHSKNYNPRTNKHGKKKKLFNNNMKKRTTSTTKPRIKPKLDVTLSPAEATRQILNDDEFKHNLKLSISQQIMNQFKSALHGAVVHKKDKKGKKKDKRSIVKKVIIIGELDSNETMNETGIMGELNSNEIMNETGGKNDTWLENYIDGGVLKDSNVVKVYQRYKRNALANGHKTTRSLDVSRKGNTSTPKTTTIKVTTESQPTTIIAKDNYYKYAFGNNTQHLTSIRNDHYKHSFNTEKTIATTISSEDQKLIVLHLRDKNNDKVIPTINRNNNNKHLETETKTTTEKVMTKTTTTTSSAAIHTVSTEYITVFIDCDKNNKSITEKSTTFIADKIFEANDLKFKNLSQIKASDEKQNVKTDNKTTLVPDINVTKERKIIHTFNVSRKVSNMPKKFKLQKLVLHKPVRNENVGYDKNTTNMSAFKNFIHKILRTSSWKRSKKSNNVIKYLQKYFRKLFGRPKNKKKANVTQMKKSMFEKHLETLCETFGPCNLDPEQKLKLESKVELLNRETNKMLRSIKIIHGLLKLLDLAGNDKNVKGETLKTNIYFKNDIKKLQAILTNTYMDKESLTNTQFIQIEYIKKNALTFMLSASKFAGILNDIIKIIQTSAFNKQILQRTSRFANITEKDQQFDNLKQLLVKFKLVQNAFVEKIYKMIPTKSISVESKKIPIQDELLSTSVNDIRNPIETGNSSKYINIYTKNIIKNLRKLKSLAKRLESGSGRRKRDLEDNDAMEYLLMLMEYLIKQNNHLDSAPVNDGIDLLIEAIKHAPDIKPIRKKVLDTLPYKMVPSTSTTEFIELITAKDDSSIYLNSISKEGNITSKFTELGIISNSEGLEDDERRGHNLNRKAFFDSTTDTDFYKKDDEWQFSVAAASTEAPLLKTHTKNEETTKNSQKTYYSHEREDDGRKVEFNAEGEEEYLTPGLSTSVAYSENEAESEFKLEMKESTTEFQLTDLKMRHFKNDRIINDSVDKKLDWVDASYEDMREDKNINKTEIEEPKFETTTTVIREEDIRKEVRKEKKKWYHPEDIIYKKEMNLLNSLDYPVARSKESKEERSDSKEGTEDKLSAETVGY